jgi:hypothetical protein
MTYMMCIECDLKPVKVDGDKCMGCNTTTDTDDPIAAWERAEARKEEREKAKSRPRDVWVDEQNWPDDHMVLILEGGEINNDYTDAIDGADPEHIGMKVFLQFTKIDWGTIKNDPNVERHQLLLPLGQAIPYFWRKP